MNTPSKKLDSPWLLLIGLLLVPFFFAVRDPLIDAEWNSRSYANGNYGGWSDASQVALYEAPAWLAARAHPVLIVGGSNSREGFREAEISENLGGRPVMNLGFSGTNFQEMRLATNWMLAGLPSQEHVTVVLNLFYGFTQTQKMLTQNGSKARSVENVATEFGDFAIRDDKIQPSGHGWWLRIKRAFLRQIGSYEFFRFRLIPANKSENRLNSAHAKEEALDFWNWYLHDSVTDPEQYSELERLTDQLLAHPQVDKIIFIESPITSWNRESARAREFHRRVLDSLNKYHSPRIVYENLSALLPDDLTMFYDSVHPTSAGADLATRRITEILSRNNPQGEQP